MLTVLEAFPSDFAHVAARDLWRVLPGPTLVHLPGRRPEPFLVSVLLHGNEDTGLKAIQTLLARHPAALPRALSVFVGNVAAAAAGERRLKEQPDYNRVWPGSATAGSAEHAMMAQIVTEMRQRRVFASVDIHNNTGINPSYSCVNVLDDRFLHFARLFSRTVVYFQRPLGVQSAAFAKCCPAITVECGKAGNLSSEMHAAELLEAALNLAHFPAHPLPSRDFDLYHTVGVVKVARDATFTFGTGEADLRFARTLEEMNFRDLPAGTVFAELATGNTRPLDVWGEDDRQLADVYFERRGAELRLKRAVTPSMLTVNERAIRQDCLCYFMERLEPRQAR